MEEWVNLKSHMHGREKILIPKPDILDEENLKRVISEAIAIHHQNEAQIDYLYKYYKGRQPIVNRIKKVRPDIKNIVVANHAYEFTTFMCRYVFGNPMQYVQRGKPGIESGYKKENIVSPLNEIMENESKGTVDKAIGKWMHICGVGYRMTLPRKEKEGLFKIASLDPRKVFVVYDTDMEETPWLCGKYFKTKKDGVVYERLCCYTENQKINYDYYGTNLSDKMVIESTVYDYLPIVEYALNEERMGFFEPVLTQMDASNVLLSCLCDAVEQNVQHIIVYINCDVDPKEHDELMKRGVMKIKNNSANSSDIKTLKVEIEIESVMGLINHIYHEMLQILHLPDRNTSSGGNTGTSLKIGEGWQECEDTAKDIALLFEASERMFLKSIFRIIKDCSAAEPILKKITIGDVGIKFARNRTDNYLVKGQGMLMELQAGIHPRIAIANSGLYNDPEQTYVDSEDTLVKWLKQETGYDSEMITNPNPTQTKKVENVNDTLPKQPITT